MSRVAKQPIALAKGVEMNIQADNVTVKGPKGTLTMAKPAGVSEAEIFSHVGETAPADWAGSFATSMRQSFFARRQPSIQDSIRLRGPCFARCATAARSR